MSENLFSLKDETTGKFFDDHSGFYFPYPTIYTKEFILRDVWGVVKLYSAIMLNHGGPVDPPPHQQTASLKYIEFFKEIRDDSFAFYEYDENDKVVDTSPFDLRGFIHSKLKEHDWLGELVLFPSHTNIFLLNHLIEGNVRGDYYLPKDRNKNNDHAQGLSRIRTSINDSYWTDDQGSKMMAKLSSELELELLNVSQAVESWNIIQSI